jgi:GNAT superfamily N-acetyltransferase
MSRLGMWRGQIEAVRIASSLRGSGVGKAMMQWAIEQCRARGCGLVQLTTDKQRPDAHRFYEALGFQATHEGMKLSLPGASS